MEFDQNQNKILQIYGKNNSNPLDKVSDFINKSWLPYAKKVLKKLKKEVRV